MISYTGLALVLLLAFWALERTRWSQRDEDQYQEDLKRGML